MDKPVTGKVFSERLRKLMVSRNTTQQELADYVGIKRQSVAQYADGSILPTIEKLAKMAAFFSVSSDYLLGISEETERPTLTDEQREVLVWLHKGGYLWVCHDVPDDTLYAFASLPTRLGNDNGAWFNTDNGAGMAYGARIECLRPLIPDWTVPLDIEKTLRDAGVEV